MQMNRGIKQRKKGYSCARLYAHANFSSLINVFKVLLFPFFYFHFFKIHLFIRLFVYFFIFISLFCSLAFTFLFFYSRCVSSISDPSATSPISS